ncbi:MAG: HAMP domain-containing protein [Candidatus Dadabacteria bacterium]|nr:MAG: HAMP domain-containing protein [Candidatus Dadabacteria bacterium]
MSLKLRLILITGSVLLFVFLAITGINTITFQNVYMDTLSEQGVNLTHLLRRQIATQLSMTSGDEASLSRFSLQLRELNEGVSGLREVMLVNGEGTILAHPDVARIGETLRPAPAKLDWDGRDTVLRSDLDRLSLFVPVHEPTSEQTVWLRADFDRNMINQTLAGIWSKAIAVMLFGLVLVFIANTWFFNRNIAQPLLSLRETFIEIGEGNLTVPMPVFRDQEFDLAARGLTGMLANLRQIVQRMTTMSVDLNETSDRLSREFQILHRESGRISENLEQTESILQAMRSDVELANTQVEDLFLLAQDTSASVLQIKASIENVDERTDQLDRTIGQTLERLAAVTAEIEKVATRHTQIATDTDDMAGAIQELALSINEVGSNAARSLTITQTVRGRADEGVGAIEGTVQEMSSIRDAVREVETRSQRLQQRSEEIEGILRVIHQVTEKTNLLALNASIIAAQAGEHGRSFSVVAEEIRDLANRVQQSTRQIEELVKGVEAETLAVGEQVRTAIEQVERGEQRVLEAKDKLLKIVESSTESDQMSQAIARAMDEQAQVSGNIAEVTNKIQSLIHDVSRATQAQAEQTSELNQTSRTVGELSAEVKRSIQEETEGARRVADAASRMENGLRQISDATARQAQESQRMTESTTENLIALRDAVRMIASFDERLTRLRSEAAELDKLLSSFRA